MILHNLFPTPVAVFDLPRALTDEELAYLAGLPRRPNMGNQSSENNYLFAEPELADLAGLVQDCVDRYASEVWRVEQTKLRITQAWMNYTLPGGYHHKHAHPNSLYSGVLYIQTDEERDRIYFHAEGYRQIKPVFADWNLYNSESWWLPVKANTVVLFPSWFTHSVDTIGDGIERSSLAFNTFPVGPVGSNQDLTELTFDRRKKK
jgi:uncharacterized protein (TIGR02466 family)